MKNTVGKGEYIRDNVIWLLLSTMWFKSWLFRCLPDYTYLESVCIFLLMLIVITVIEIALTIEWGRNGVSVVQNLCITWGIYIVFVYIDVCKNRIITVSIIMFVVSTIMTMLVMLRKIKRKNKKKDIIRKRLKNVVCIWRRNAVIAALVLFLPMLLSLIINGTVINADFDSVKTYGDEHCLDANIEEISKVYPDIWKTLTFKEKLNVAQVIVNCECRYNGISHEVNVGARELGDNLHACYAESIHQIIIDIGYLEDSDGYKVLETLIHECAHAYQHEQVKVYCALDEKSRNLLMFDDISIYLNEFRKYEDGDDSYTDYYGQLVEKNARETAKESMQLYIYKIDKYLERNKK